jgi:RimJ/RimL family protein N-acetyltransferase
MNLTLNIPTLTTDRLILRGPQAQDLEPHVEFFADADRSWGFGGPEDRNGAWRWFASSVGQWALNGYGYWTITDKDTNAIYGITGLWHPAGWPEAELGWVAFAGAEGKGFIYEAALAARAYAFANFGITKLPSYIMPGNTRSIALAERMGATYESSYENISHGTELIYRHPTPEAGA